MANVEELVYEEELVASICKENFFDFVVEFWDTIIEEEFTYNWHIEYICNELQIVAERVFEGKPKLYDLVINVPPGSTKSTICSQMFPAWVWTKMASAKFICGSYAYPIALKDSLKTRDIVQSEKYQKSFPILLREDENTKGLFTNMQTGFRLSVSVGGMVTGYHGHFLMMDDPINPEEAFSDAEIKGVSRWMESTLPSRKIDKKITPLILIQQRLHEADPSGELLARKRDKIKHICLPGELTDRVSPPELAAKYVDGLLDPVRLPREVLDELQADMGPYGYAGQVLQDPVPLGGGMFEVDKIKLVDEIPFKVVRQVRSWDKAGTEGGGAWSVGLEMGVSAKNEFAITDIRRGQWGSAKREDMIRATAEEDGDDIEVVLEIEGGSGGKESGENTVRNLAGFKIYTFHPTGDKETRAYPLSSQVGGGSVYCLKRSWTKAFLHELRYFPNGKYKDQVDAASAAFNRLAKRKRKVGAAW